MQNALEEMDLSLGPADVDQGGILRPGTREAEGALARVVVQSVEDFFNHDRAVSLLAGQAGSVFAQSRHVLANHLRPIRKAAGLTKWPKNGLRTDASPRTIWRITARLALDMGHSTTK
jgi:hypothetical protein